MGMRLELQHLTIGYDNDKTVVQDFTYCYETPSILCLLGKNGAGKSSILKTIMGQLQPRYGEIFLNDTPIRRFSSRELARHIAYLPQYHQPKFNFSVIDVVRMGRHVHHGIFSCPTEKDQSVALQHLQCLGISHLAAKSYTQISGGERKLVLLAAALSQEPEVLLLDEPTSCLDFGHQYQFLDLVKNLQHMGKGIIMTTHFPEHPLYLDADVAIIDKQHVTQTGNAKRILTDHTLSQLYGLPLRVRDVDGMMLCYPKHIKKSESKS